MAARRNLSVVVFDRSQQATGATVRNFGMIWPIGQPAGELYEIARRSRDFWLELARHDVLKAEQCGSVHLAHHEDELALLGEFCEGATHECELLTPSEVEKIVPVVNSDGLLGGMYSPTELRVDPRTAAQQLAGFLHTNLNVELNFDTAIVDVESGKLSSSAGKHWSADQIIICSGSDLQTLYPTLLAESKLKLCKLQMLRTVPNKNMKQDCHIASGLTLRHYHSFENCPSLQKLRSRIAERYPELDKHGIHVMATQSADGSFILGDSHEYGRNISPFDKPEIDELILRELRKIMRLNNWSIAERWSGIYAKHPDLPIYRAEPDPDVHIAVGTSGAGMTMSFGLANHVWSEWID